ncbi:MAG: MarR family winged helix-turn-helix transcriptional regulator [Beutenbergiaceae bacterium]
MTQWLDAEQQRQWRDLLVGSQTLVAALQRDLEAVTGLSFNEYEVLVRLSESPDRTVRMSVLADGLVHSRSRMTHTVRRMERRNLVQRRAAAGDGRGVDCVMTEQGWSLLQTAAPIHVTSVRNRLVDVISAEELATMGRAFTKVRCAITHDPPD